MNDDAMASFRSAAETPDREDEPDDRPEVTCADCGAFLGSHPQGSYADCEACGGFTLSRRVPEPEGPSPAPVSFGEALEALRLAAKEPAEAYATVCGRRVWWAPPEEASGRGEEGLMLCELPGGGLEIAAMNGPAILERWILAGHGPLTPLAQAVEASVRFLSPEPSPDTRTPTMGDSHTAHDEAHDEAQVSAPKSAPSPNAIPTPEELLGEPAIDYTNRIAFRVAEVVESLRLAPRKPVTVRDDVPVIQGVADAMRAAKWSAHTSLHRNNRTGTVTVSVPKPIDPRLFR